MFVDVGVGAKVMCTGAVRPHCQLALPNLAVYFICFALCSCILIVLWQLSAHEDSVSVVNTSEMSYGVSTLSMSCHSCDSDEDVSALLSDKRDDDSHPENRSGSLVSEVCTATFSVEVSEHDTLLSPVSSDISSVELYDSAVTSNKKSRSNQSVCTATSESACELDPILNDSCDLLSTASTICDTRASENDSAVIPKKKFKHVDSAHNTSTQSAHELDSVHNDCVRPAPTA